MRADRKQPKEKSDAQDNKTEHKSVAVSKLLD